MARKSCPFHDVALAWGAGVTLTFLIGWTVCLEEEIAGEQARLTGPNGWIASCESTLLHRNNQFAQTQPPDGRPKPTAEKFSFGFFAESPGFFTLAIYSSNYGRPRRIWAASDENRAAIRVAENATLRLEVGGNLVLLDSHLKQIWSTNTSGTGAIGLELQQSGNLVLFDAQQNRVWQSFDSPIDVLLPGQNLSMGMKLVNGKFSLLMEDDALVLYSGNLRKQMWSFHDMHGERSPRHNCKGPFLLEFRTDGIHLSQHDTTNTSDAFGDEWSEGCNRPTVARYPLKVMMSYAASAMWLSDHGTVHVDVHSANVKLLGIYRRSRSRRLVGMQHKKCRSSLRCDYCHNCFVGDTCKCSLSTEWYTSLKISGRGLNLGFQDADFLQTRRFAFAVLGVLLGAASVALVSFVCATKKPDENRLPVSNKSVQEALRDSLPEEFSFRTLRKITNNFSSKLGDGGFGLVYEGLFKDKSRVAVKVLDRTSTQGEKEFRAEVTMMASTRHMNVMHLRGFCAEKAHRLLVYDYMPNASLDKWIFNPSGRFSMLDWVTRFKIAVGTARGLAYLHEECAQQIIHLDVKPENILLDENFVPKVADFGLSKLIDRERSRVVTNTRGTPGYLAPEWVQRSSVTAKVDVYSFGIVLLELICGRETIDMSMGSELWYLPAWAVRMVEEGRALEIVDPRIREEVTFFFEEQGKRVIRVALCCIQEDPAARPVMSRVVQMLEGVVDPKTPSVTRVSTQPTAARLKDKLKAYVEAISDGYTHAVTMESNHKGANENGGGGHQNGNEDVGILVASGHAVLKPKNGPTIPPWPLKGDVVLVRGVGDKNLHAVIRDVRVRLKQVKLAFLRKLEDTESSERWVVDEEESIWRQWSVMVRTLEFWIPVRWTTLPMSGSEKFPVEWLVK